MSEQGNKAFREIGLARLAIFDAKPAAAAQLVTAAQASPAKAKTDNTAYNKAESELKMPPALAGKQPPASGTTPIAWLPIDGSLSLTDEITETPEKKAAIAKANEHLKKGDRIKAIEVLKLADINVAYSVLVAPLDKTVDGVNKAAALLKADKYYEANEALKNVQDNVRLDWYDVNAVPTAQAKPGAAK